MWVCVCVTLTRSVVITTTNADNGPRRVLFCFRCFSLSRSYSYSLCSRSSPTRPTFDNTVVRKPQRFIGKQQIIRRNGPASVVRFLLAVFALRRNRGFLCSSGPPLYQEYILVRCRRRTSSAGLKNTHASKSYDR